MIRGGQTALDEAQDLIYDAWEASSAEEAAFLALDALKISPDCADAYVILAQIMSRTLEEAIYMYRQAVEAGERALGKEAFEEDVGYFWGALETRPYMRARLGLAQCLWEAGDYEEAVEHYWELLRLNPMDNQGVRGLLMPGLIELNRDDDAERLFAQFNEDCMAVWMYSRALLDFRKHGESPVADESLRAALNENKHVPAYLLGDKKLPDQHPDYYGFGDTNEAVIYAIGNRDAWKSTPGSLVWLASKTE